MGTPTVVIVEDEVIIRTDMAFLLRDFGFTVVGETGYGEEAVELVEQTVPSIVLFDIRLQGALDGVEAAKLVQRRVSVPVIFMSAYDSRERVLSEDVPNVRAYLSKPVHRAELKAALEQALSIRL